ncbi:MAG: tetratricopeptide repeat protein [Bacteroidota bacterium]
MAKRYFKLTFVFILFFAANSFAQEEDELKKLFLDLKNASADTSKIRLYNDITKYYISQRNDSANIYNKLSLELSEKTNLYNFDAHYSKANILIRKKDLDAAYPLVLKNYEIAKNVTNYKDIARALYHIGVYYNTKNDYNKSLNFGLLALALREQLKDTADITSSLSMVGQIYKTNYKFTDGLKYYLKSARFAELTKDSAAQYSAYINLGTLYQNSSDNDKALQFYIKALRINEVDNDENGFAICYSKLGSAYAQAGNYDSSYYYTYKAYEIHVKNNEKGGLLNSQQKLGGILFEKKEYEKSLAFLDKALEIALERKDTLNISSILSAKARNYFGLKNYDEALKLLEYVKKIYPKNFGYLFLSNLNFRLSEIYKLNGDYTKAYEYFVLHKASLDSVAAQNDIKKQTELKLAYEFDQQQEIQRQIAHEKEIENQLVLKAEKKNQYFLMAFLALAIVIIFIAIRNYNQKRKSNFKLEKQNVQLEFQKKLVEAKNREISDSINYAKHIQTACLPDVKQLNESFTDYYLVYKPKDVVSGDFFWSAKTDSHVFLAIADCTGHGVPGAIMSMIGSMLLNEIFYVKNIHSPEKILSELNRLIKLTLKQYNNPNSRDGMDIAFCVWNTQSNEVLYAGANRPLYVLSEKGELREYKASKLSVGGNTDLHQEYELNKLYLQKGERVVLTTDGYPDQFGGDKDKKLNTKWFKEKIISVYNLNSEEQKQELTTFFENWKGTNEQTDDVLVFSFRV